MRDRMAGSALILCIPLDVDVCGRARELIGVASHVALYDSWASVLP